MNARKKKVWPIHGENNPYKSVSEEAQTLDKLDKDFKSAILTMFKQLRESTPKEKHNVSPNREYQ